MTTERIVLPKKYRPLVKEEYMCPEHLEYFRNKLTHWRGELIEESKETINPVWGLKIVSPAGEGKKISPPSKSSFK